MQLVEGEVMRVPIIAAAALLLLPGAAAAQDCRDQVEALADKLGLSTELPEAPSSGGAQQQQPDAGDLAESGGVIEPPDTGADIPTIEPAPGQSPDMPTAPDVQPQTPGGGDNNGQSAKNAQIQSLLTAARQAAEAGNNQRCLDRLQEATALAAVPGTDN